MRKTLLLLLLTACSIGGKNPPTGDPLAEYKTTLAATGGDVRLNYNDLSVWQVGQIFSPITEDYTDRNFDTTRAAARFGAMRDVLTYGLEYKSQAEAASMTFSGTFTGEAFGRYAGEHGEALTDYGVAKLVVKAPDDMRLDLKLAKNGEFNNVQRYLDLWYSKGGDIKATGGTFIIPAGMTNPAIEGSFFTKKN